MSIKINDAGATTYLHNPTVGAVMAASPGTYTFAVWFKSDDATPTANDCVFSVIHTDGAGGGDGHNVSAIAIWAGSGPYFLTTFCRANNINSSQPSIELTPNVWNLAVMRMTVGTTASIRYSYNGANTSIEIASLGSGGNIPQNVALGAIIRDTSLLYCQEIKYAHPAIWSGELTNGQIDELYGSGPSAGDALSPALVNASNLIAYDRFIDGNSNPDVGGSWAAVGSDVTKVPDDNPSLVLPITTRVLNRPRMRRALPENRPNYQSRPMKARA